MLMVYAMVCTGIVHAQYWKPVGRGVVGSTNIQSLYADTVLDRLLVGGTFIQMANMADTVLCISMAQWDGVQFDSIATRVTDYSGSGTSQTHWFFRHQGELYANGGWGFYEVDSTIHRYYARLDTALDRWVGLGCEQPTISSIQQFVPKEPTDTLFATGFPEPHCGLVTSPVFRYDGSDFESWPPFAAIPSDPNNYVAWVFKFLSHTYVSGSFRDPFSPGWVSFMRYGPGGWEYVPGWGPQQGAIKEFNVRNDTLYLCGAFKKSQGAPGNLIAAFTGSNWLDFGDGLRFTNPASAVALDMEWWNDELYVTGWIDMADSITAPAKIAKWNGQRWCTLPGDLESANLIDMAIWRDTLYVVGGFDTADGQPARQIAQWIGGNTVFDCAAPVGIPERDAPVFSLHPNPATSSLTLSVPSGTTATTVLLTDPLGREVLRHPLRGTTTSLNVRTLAPGPYLAVLLDATGNRLGAVRWVKE